MSTNTIKEDPDAPLNLKIENLKEEAEGQSMDLCTPEFIFENHLIKVEALDDVYENNEPEDVKSEVDDDQTDEDDADDETYDPDIKKKKKPAKEKNSNNETSGASEKPMSRHGKPTPTFSQQLKLIEIMESKKWLAMAQARTQKAREKHSVIWDEIANILNKESDECVRSAKSWCKYWKDKKGTVKRKVVLFNANKHDPCCEKDYMSCLNKFEQRIMRLIEECSDTSQLHTRGSDMEATSEEEEEQEEESMLGFETHDVEENKPEACTTPPCDSPPEMPNSPSRSSSKRKSTRNRQVGDLALMSIDNIRDRLASIEKKWAEKVMLQQYSEEMVMHIEIETISEEERQLEHRELLNARLHMRFVCEWCALGFVVEDAYKEHQKIHSPENGAHECDICHSRVKTADVLYRHKLRHYRRYRCDLCDLRMRDKDSAAAHIMRDHYGATFKCSHCGRSFKRPQYLKRHIEQMHTRATEYECPVCKRIFYERGWYRCHVRTHNEEVRIGQRRPVNCSHCGREFKNKQYLKRHLLTHEGREVDCKLCGREFKNAEVLRAHYRQQHSEHRYMLTRIRSECTQCGRICATPAMLQRHTQRMHSDRTKRFECAHCERRYLTKGEVRSHIMWSHLRRRGGHACACGRVFRSPARLRHHAAAHHLRLPQPRDKPCPVCGKAFANQQVLTRHIKGHSGETYPCTECGQTFKTQSYVKVHYKIKHLNMTRAQIKAESKRKLLMVDEHIPENMINYRERLEHSEDPLNFTEVDIKDIMARKEPEQFEAVQIKIELEDEAEPESEVDIQIPKFETFVDIQRD